MGTSPIPVKPGRGAWTADGGLLPPKPGEHGKGYCYRPPFPGEAMIGAAAKRPGSTYSEYVVGEAVRALQRLLGVPADGLLGDVTGAAIAAFQGRHGLIRDAIVGPKTMRALVEPLVLKSADRWGVPVADLGGIAVWESQLDLAAVGVTTPDDLGPVQINRASTGKDMTVEQIIDPAFALDFTAKNLRIVTDRWKGQTKADPTAIAVASHNSPKSARAWALSNNPDPQILAYVGHVRGAWS